METHERCTIFMSWRHLRELSRWHKPKPVTGQYDIVSCRMDKLIRLLCHQKLSMVELNSA
jgi:hypothetical protein